MKLLLVTAALALVLPLAGAARVDAVRVGTLSRAATMSTPRAAHTSTTLVGGNVLVVGGCSRPGCELGSSPARLAELYDRRSARFRPAGRMLEWRDDHTATLLPDGRVLIAGGWGEAGVVATTELYDPGRRVVEAGPAMASRRSGATATLLGDGSVLVAGGFIDNKPTTAAAEVFDPSANVFRPLPPMSTSRGAHTASQLPDGRVLVAGGVSNGQVVRTTELFDPRTGTFTPGPLLRVPRSKAASITLSGGRVLIVGGTADLEGSVVHRSTEIYNPQTNRFLPGPTMRFARQKIGGSVVRLGTGEILVAGGAPVAELLDAKATRFRTVGGSLRSDRRVLTVSRIGARQALLVGGYDPGIRPTAETWLYR